MPELVIRRYEDTDEPAVLALLAASLGKTVDDRYRAFFHWKHLENPFGRSFMWVGEVDGRLAGFRSFLRWRFIDPAGDPVEAVRAVDTATHPDSRGMGIFQKLTLHGLDEMKPEGIQFVFNTPNEQSRPGYLKMGWRVEGRVPVKVRPRSVPALWRMARARTAAEAWSLPVDVGEPVASLADDLLGAANERRPGVLVTDRRPEFIRWRYGGCASVASIAVSAGAGAVLMRFRTRGESVECTVGDVIGVGIDARTAGRSVRAAMAASRADYAIAAALSPVAGMIPTNRLGPIQTRRDVSERPSTLPLALSLGELELF